jgi:hypothetical protein
MFGNPKTDQFATGFGQITGTVNYQRQFQFVARFSF